MDNALTTQDMRNMIRDIPNEVPAGKHKGKTVIMCPDCYHTMLFANEQSQHKGYSFCFNPMCGNKYLYDDEGNNTGKQM